MSWSERGSLPRVWRLPFLAVLPFSDQYHIPVSDRPCGRTLQVARSGFDHDVAYGITFGQTGRA